MSDGGVTDTGAPRDTGPADGSLPDTATGDAIVPPGDAGGCTASMESCSEGVAMVCNASTGALEPLDCPLGCSPSEARCGSVAPSNVDPALLDPAAKDLLWDADVMLSTETCEFGTPTTQPGGAEVCAISAGAVTVSANVSVTGTRPLVIVAYGAVDISGSIDVSAYGTTPGPGGGRGGTSDAPTGSGPAPGTRGAQIGNWADGGASGGALCGAGGSGGQGGYSAAGGEGPAAVAPGELSPLIAGSGGGWANGAPSNWSDGGAGGGALQITSRVSITLGGRIRAGGGGGRGANANNGNYGAGAGGGSGGAVLLEAPTIEAPGGGRVHAAGGGGGGSAGEGNASNGDDGAQATGTADGGASSGGYWSANGGRSGGGSTLDGETGSRNRREDSGNGGGGGGGAGCILLRTADSTVPASFEDSTPSVADGLRAMSLRVR